MSKVLLVNQLTGAAQAIDTEGKPATVAEGMLSSFEATIAMNRLAEGYIQIPLDHYALRLDIVEYNEQGGSIAITGLIVLDDTGEPKVLKTYTEEDARSHKRIDASYSLAMAKLDTENDLISWANNPLLPDAYTFSFDTAPKVTANTPMEEMLYLFRLRQKAAIEPAEVLILAHFKD